MALLGLVDMLLSRCLMSSSLHNCFWLHTHNPLLTYTDTHTPTITPTLKSHHHLGKAYLNNASKPFTLNPSTTLDTFFFPLCLSSNWWLLLFGNEWCMESFWSHSRPATIDVFVFLGALFRCRVVKMNARLLSSCWCPCCSHTGRRVLASETRRLAAQSFCLFSLDFAQHPLRIGHLFTYSSQALYILIPASLPVITDLFCVNSNNLLLFYYWEHYSGHVISKFEDIVG